MRRLLLIATSLTFLQCDVAPVASPTDPSEVDKPGTEPAKNTTKLLKLASCQAVEEYIEGQLTAEWQEYRNYYGDGGIAAGNVSSDAESASPSTPPPGVPGGPVRGGNAQGPSAHTDTNTQVAGVQEPDIVKTDGKQTFVLAQNQLHWVKSWPADQMAAIDQHEIQGWAQNLFLDETGRLVVLSSVGLKHNPDGSLAKRMPSNAPPEEPGGTGHPNPPSPLDRCAVGRSIRYTKLTVFSAANSRLRVVDEIYVPGTQMAARRVGQSLRLVVQSDLEMPCEVVYRRYDSHAPDVEARMTAAIQAKPLKHWLPAAYRRVGNTLEALPQTCSDFYRGNHAAELGLLSIVTVKLPAAGDTTPASVQQTSLLASAQIAYADRTALYVASPMWGYRFHRGRVTSDEQTQTSRNFSFLHKFDISDPARASWVASGTVPGNPINSFALDAYEDKLRVATTVFEYSLQDPGLETYNQLNIFETQGQVLRRIGGIDRIAKNETIKSVRFLGPKGYVVTFRNIDPLFTMDLSQPTQPRILGELKVPGFSTYLHPIGENHLLTIGVSVPDGASRSDGLKLSLFDVSDMAHPRETATLSLGPTHGYSEALTEHLAFNYFAERGVLAIPFIDAGSKDGSMPYRNDLRLYRVNLQTGFQHLGNLSMTDVRAESSDNPGNASGGFSPFVRRSIMADDFAYAISDGGIRSARITAPSSTLSTVRFQP